MEKNIWEQLLNESEFNSEIKLNGHSKQRKFTDYLKKYKINKSNTSQNLSIDFYSKQSISLKEKNLYLVKSGKGKFIIFDNKRFNMPYLNLKHDTFEEIKTTLPKDSKEILDIYKDNLVENSALELLHYVGGYDYLIKKESESEKYFIGPRGDKVSKFNVYMYDKKDKIDKFIFQYDGQEDLDYSIVTENEVFLFEAKALTFGGFDLSYHKLVFPSNRFKNLKNKNIIPCYYLKHKNEILIFVFPQIKFYKKGIILNDKNSLIPKKVYKLDLAKLFDY